MSLSTHVCKCDRLKLRLKNFRFPVSSLSAIVSMFLIARIQHQIDKNVVSVASRSFIALAMILQVLLCPYLGCDKGEASMELTAATGACQCRHQESDDDGQPFPVNDCPDNCCSCNCFCAGAVPVDTVDCPKLVVSNFAHSWLDGAFSPIPLQLAAATTPFGLSSGPSANWQGRSVSTMTECWLL